MASVVISCVLVVCWLFVYLFQLAAASQLRKMKSGDYFVHWSYNGQEWNELFQVESQKSKLTPAKAAGLCGVIGGCFSFGILAEAANIYYLGIGIVLAASVTPFAGFMLTYARRQNRLHKLQTGAATILIGQMGLYYVDRYESFAGTGQGLESLDIVKSDNKESLRFNFWYQAKHGLNYETILVPIPKGHEFEARAVRHLVLNG